MNLPFQAYQSGEYLSKNPTWDMEDSPWKGAEVLKIWERNRLSLGTIVEVGCGAGGVLAYLQSVKPNSQYSGYEIAESAASFWESHRRQGVSFEVADFLSAQTPHYDALLLLDVLEHLPNPFDFLSQLKGRADYYIFHVPLDLSALSVVRESPLLNVREKVGHIHYFTKGLAFSLFRECGYEILDWNYTGASLSVPQATWKTKLARLPRRLAYAINRDIGVRLLGGDTLMVLAKCT